MSRASQVCAWIVGILVAWPSVAVAQSWSEREVVDAIVRDGPQAAAIRAGTDVVRREQQARLAPVNPSVSYSREGAGFAEFLEVEQPLGPFGVRSALARAGLAAAAVAEAERDARLWLLRAQAAEAAARLVAAQSLVVESQEHVQRVEQLLVILRTREREGEGSRFDRLRAEQELRDARQRATSAAVSAAESGAILAGLLPSGVRAGTITPSASVQATPLTLESLLGRTTSARAELRAFQQAVDRTVWETAVARRLRLPMPTIFGGVKRGDSSATRTTGGVFGLSLSVPVFDTGNRDGARWLAEAHRIGAERAGFERRVHSEVTAAFETLALRRAAQAEDPGDSGRELMQIAELAYREGELGILELLDAARAVSRARTRQIELRLDARLAEIALERAVGDVLWP